MRYVLGLDIGTTTVGWAVIDLDQHRIENLGVRAFNAAENPKTRESLAKPRREARSTRRRLRRRRGRLDRAQKLFVEHGLLTSPQIETAFVATNAKPDPWQLRTEGLDRLLTGEEFARALYHIAKHRGFKSNAKRNRTNDDDSKMLSGIRANRERLAGYRTVGEMFFRDDQFKSRKRNRDQDYSHTVDRSMLEAEIRALFEAQRSAGNRLATPEFESRFLEVFGWQLPFASGDAILDKIGDCTFEKGEKRAPRACYSAERFILLQRLNNLEVQINGHRRPLTDSERAAIVEMAHSKKEVNYTHVRKALSLPEEARFAGVPLRYMKRKDGIISEDLDCEKSTFCKLPGYHALREALSVDGLWDSVKDSHELLDDLAFALTVYKTDDDIRECLQDRAPAAVVEALCKPGAPSFDKVVHLSLAALRKINPHLEQGLTYDKACEAAGYTHYDPKGEAHRKTKLPPFDPEEFRNPVALRALTQARKVVNNVIERYGSPTYVNIELAREIGKGPEERRKIEKRIKENTDAREQDNKRFVEEFSREPKGEDKAKWRLYREQNGQCAYSGKAFELARLFEPGYAEIDHILPYSRSFDNRFSNRVLVHAAENRNKGNRTPHEYFGADAARWARFEAWVAANVRDRDKRANLLAQDFEARQEDWMQRSLTDTQYVARFFSNYVKRHLAFADAEVKQPVRCLAGGVTSLARGLWELGRTRQEKEALADDTHHALDAAVIACLTPGRIKAITEYSQAQETGRGEVTDPETGEIYEVLRDKPFHFPPPWKGFRHELLDKLPDILVSRMSIRKASGALHAETIRSSRELDGKPISVTRKKLIDLKPADLDKLCHPEANAALYDAIRKRLAECGNDAKAAFADGIRKPSKNPDKAPIVRSVKICESQPSGIAVRNGVADNDKQVRTDVFTRDGKYYLVPLFTADIAAGRLPDTAIGGGKGVQLDDSYGFLFSLYPYDLVRVVWGDKDFTGYYRGTDISTGTITISPPSNNRAKPERPGMRQARLVEKYHVDVLGAKHLVTSEKRVGLLRSSKPLQEDASESH